MVLLLRENVLSAKQRLAAGHDELRQRHRLGCAGLELCAEITALRDAVLIDLAEAAVRELQTGVGELAKSQIALVAHGGYGRGALAPYSDVDVMILHRSGAAAAAAPLAERLLRDVFDAGLVLGHSVRTPGQACRLAASDPQICTSLMESRLLAGDGDLFGPFAGRFRSQVRRRFRPLGSAIDRARREERARYGETVFLLEPNVKRSRGGLRDLQLVRWIGLARYGTADFARLQALGALTEEDHEVLARAQEFLLWLRNEMHFHAGQAADVLDRAEQVRIAGVLGYQRAGGLLPVEQFMRDYFRHTGGVSHVATRFVAAARSRDRLTRLGTSLFGHRIEGGLRIGPAGILATRRGLRGFRGDLAGIVRLAELANLYDVPIAPSTWEAVRREAARLGDELSPEARRRFLALLAHPARLGPLLADLHDAAILERFIPEFAHARGLLQFNQYHKYTVDEHCIRSVEAATEFQADEGPPGRVYRSISQKHLLHLALLLHDLGKGQLEDHREVGLEIAGRTAERLGLGPRDAETLKFLVHKHMVMNHAAFRRDTADQQTVVRFAVRVGSPELLKMLYVLTAADLSAVGPGVWDGWKSQIVTDLYHRTMQHLSDDSPATTLDRQIESRREAVRTWLGRQRDDAWFAAQLDALPPGYLSITPAQQAAADLRLLRSLEPGGASAAARYLPETQTVEFTVGTSEEVVPGIFHRLTGALTSLGLEIRSAQINTLADGLVLDRFWVCDPDFAGPPPAERLGHVNAALVQSLLAPKTSPPTFRRLWQVGGAAPATARLQTRILWDNTNTDRYTVLDIFTHDRSGLLYAISRTLFEMGLSVWRAKIGTYLDQVVDVFYVTDQQRRKVADEARLEQIRQRLLEVIDRPSEAGQSADQ
jgi:[protein-PII] uridylyltransferase